MQKKEVYNPYLPLNEYIPDGEPHQFGDRVYLFGSHDREGGHTFCMEDYAVYSAAVNDLSCWRKEGIIYRAEQDPDYDQKPYMYAPDVVQGNDGKYYLYYCMSGIYGQGGYQGPISVAVCDTPAGKYEYLGHVQNKDGSVMMKYICFDPAVMNDDGVIRLTYGTQYDFEERDDFDAEPSYMQSEVEMFGRSEAEIRSYPDSIMGPVMCILEDDMLTVKEEPKHIIPYRVKGTSFEEHPFFEAASLRRIMGRYYFIYSSWQNHELCYAVSDHPDQGYEFGGTIVSNGDIGYDGRSEADKLNMTGTTHGSVIELNGQWYVFYHRLTHKSDYSRQACAEKIVITQDGRILQSEITSCGLNEGPLKAKGTYPAVIACNLTNGRMPHGSNSIFRISFPNVTNCGEERFIGEIEEGTLIGYKYFDLSAIKTVGVSARLETERTRVVCDAPTRTDQRSGEVEHLCGTIRNPGITRQEPMLEVRLEETGKAVAWIPLDRLSENWQEYSAELTGSAYSPLYFVYHGNEKIQMKELFFQ